MIRIVIIALFISAACSCRTAPGKIIGIKIYDYAGDYSALASTWKSMGINTAFISEKLAADGAFREELAKRGISVYLIFPVFNNEEAISEDSTLYAITNSGNRAQQEWLRFVCPSRSAYREYLNEKMTDVISELKPDGVSIDFIRQFVYWEKIYPYRDPSGIEKACYCDSCLARFEREYEKEIPAGTVTTLEKAAWIERNCPAEWDEFRCGLITSMVSELSETAHRACVDISVNLHIVPWRSADFGNAIIKVASQDVAKMKEYTDFISPMCYSQMVDRDSKWISDVVKDMDLKAGGMVIPSIQVWPYYIDRPMDNGEFRNCLREALMPPSRGVIFFSWPLFEKDSSRMDVVRQVIEQI